MRTKFFASEYRPTDAEVRADWTGETAQARFQGASQEDARYVSRQPIPRPFGRKVSK